MLLRLSRGLRLNIPTPQFSTSRFLRRPNMLEADRARFYYWNLFSVAVTALPVWYMLTVNYRFCEESVKLSESLKGSKPKLVDLGLYYPEKLGSA